MVPFEDAIGHYTRQLETNKTANNYWNRAKIWRLKGELDIALGDMNDAIRLNSTESAWLHNRGVLWKNKKDYDKAIADYEEANRLDPKFVYPFIARAWLRATCPDAKHRNGQQAVEYATKACELTAWKNADYLDTLAAAYAEAGDFDKAVEWQKKGIDLAPADQKAAFETRLKLYQDKKPYREPAP